MLAASPDPMAALQRARVANDRGPRPALARIHRFLSENDKTKQPGNFFMSYAILVWSRLRNDPVSACARLVSLAGTALTSKPQANLKSVAAAALSGNGFPDRHTTCNRHGRGSHVAG
jgi:hypothetical protein